MNGVIEGNFPTVLDIAPELVIQSKLEQSENIKEVTVLGRYNNGQFFLATSMGDMYHTYYWLDYVKKYLEEI